MESNAPMESNERSMQYIVGFYVLIVISAILRFRDLTFQSMWGDELSRAASAFEATWEGAMSLAGLSKNGGFFRWEVYWIGRLFGTNELAFRAFSASCGVILVALVCEIGRSLHSEFAGLVSAALLAVSKSAIKYSQEFAPYSSGNLFVWLVFALIILRKNRTFWIDMVIAGLANYVIWLHTHSAVVIFLGTNVLLLQAILYKGFDKKSGDESVGFQIESVTSEARLWFVINTAFIFRIPGLRTISDDDGHSGWIPDYSISSSIQKPINWYFGNIGDLNSLLVPIILASPILVFVSVRLKNSDWRMQPEWFLWLSGPVFIILLIAYSQISRPALHERYIQFSLPAFCLIFGITVSRVFEMASRSADKPRVVADSAWASILLCTLLVFQGLQGLHESEYYTEVRKSDFRGMSQYLDGEDFDEDTFIISQPNAGKWNTYLSMMGSEERVDYGKWETEMPNKGYELINETQPETVVYVIGHVVSRFEDSNFINFLEGGFELIDYQEFYQGKVWVYQRGGNV